MKQILIKLIVCLSVMVVFVQPTGSILTYDKGKGPTFFMSKQLAVEVNTTGKDDTIHQSSYKYSSKKITPPDFNLPKVPTPIIEYDILKNEVSISCIQPDAVIHYTLDKSIPTEKDSVYKSPFIPRNFVYTCVKAVAMAEGYEPSDMCVKFINYVYCDDPILKSYDGRYVSFKIEPGAVLYYVIGDEKDSIDGTLLTDDFKVDLKGLNTIKVRAMIFYNGKVYSDEVTFTPEYYANETDGYTSRPGVLSQSFEWCKNDLSQIQSLSIHGTLNDNSVIDSGDYGFISSLPALRHLNLSEVTDIMVPDSAFASAKLVSLTFPETMRNVGKGIFGNENSNLCAAQWLSDDRVPAHLLEGVNNSNILLYVKDRALVNDLLEHSGEIVSNVVIMDGITGDNSAEHITLLHAYPFYSPSKFMAKKISFTRSFTKETQIEENLGSGWETLIVPFDVDNVTSANRVFKPFGEAVIDNGDHPFWLFKPVDTQWQSEKKIYANVPYLVAFPNNPIYADKYCVNGDVVFCSTNVEVQATPDKVDLLKGFGVSRYIVGNYDYISREENILAINDVQTSYDNRVYLPGGIFISGQKDVVPFECYVESNGSRAISVFDRTAVDELLGEYGTQIWSEPYAICIRSGLSMKLRIYDMVGQLIRIVDVKEGESVRLDGITPGIYFVGTTKIFVKG